MSENKFIRHLKGEGTAKSLLEIKNQSTPTTFANMPNGTSDANTVYSDHRGNATGVLKGAENWKINGSALVESSTIYGDGRDFIDSYRTFGNSVWVDATFTLASAKRFLANTKFVLKLCGSKLDSVIEDTIGFTLIVSLGNNTTITKTFQVTEQAFDFCKEFVIDFAESNASAVKLDAADTIKVQLVCADATASATIYNGMTVFTALQRCVDGETVASDKKTFDEVVQDIDDINEEFDDIHEDIDDLEDYVDDTFVRLDGNSIMTGPLKMRATSSFQCAIAPYWDGVGFFKLNNDNSVTLIASIDITDGFLPWTTNTYNIGSSLKKWKNLYLSEKMYVATINNGGDLSVPANTTGTLATKADVDLAANSGRMITDEGVWYAKMDAAGTIPSYAEVEGRNYADFTQTNQDGDPIIVIYTYTSGVWTETETIIPPAQYDGYVPVTSKIWDIAEQTGQQGGRILWNHQTKTFTPYPLIISTDNMNITNSSFQGNATLSGESTVVMPLNPVSQQIVNKDYVDNKAATKANVDMDNLSITGKANISKQGTYDSNETYSAGTIGAELAKIADKADTDLSNLTATGKGKLGPTVYNAFGFLLNSVADTCEGYGTVTVSLYPNGIAIVDFNIEITANGTGSAYFLWGLNRNLIKNINSNIPTITPISGGSLTYYNTSGYIAADRMGFGGIMVAVGEFWQPARIYTTSGDWGGWPANACVANQRIIGVCYGTYTV